MTTTKNNEQNPNKVIDTLKLNEPTQAGEIISEEFINELAEKLYAEIPKFYPSVELPRIGVEKTNEIVNLTPDKSKLLQAQSNKEKGKHISLENPIPEIDSKEFSIGEINFRSLLAIPEHQNPKSIQGNTSLNRYYFISESVPAFSAPKVGQVFNVRAVRNDFPILQEKIHGKPLIWFDNAATSQKPQAVIDAVKHYYEHDNSNVHRGIHTLAGRATDAYEAAREKVRQFIGARSTNEIVFVRGTTEAINLVAQTLGRTSIGMGDEIIITTIEHHSNIVPWQFLVQEKCAKLRIASVDDRGEIILEEYEKLFNPRTKLVALTHVSNALGTVLPIRTMIDIAHHHGAYVLIDGAQAVPHFRVNVESLDCDFYTFSGHKVFAPTGIGVLFGKNHLLKKLPPWQGGGSMIDKVSFEETTIKEPPDKFEAGTPIIASAIGLGAAIDYLNQIGFDTASHYEHELIQYAIRKLSVIPGLRLIGNPSHRVGVISFLVDGLNPESLGKFLDEEGIAVRAGHHCAQPTMKRFGIPATVRASLAFYNTHDEIDALIAAIEKAKQFLVRDPDLLQTITL